MDKISAEYEWIMDEPAAATCHATGRLGPSLYQNLRFDISELRLALSNEENGAKSAELAFIVSMPRSLLTHFVVFVCVSTFDLESQ